MIRSEEAVRTIEANAETHLPTLLEQVEQGETVVITRDGRAIARIVPDIDGRSAEVGRILAEIETFRKTMPQFTVEEILSARHEGHER